MVIDWQQPQTRDNGGGEIPACQAVFQPLGAAGFGNRQVRCKRNRGQTNGFDKKDAVPLTAVRSREERPTKLGASLCVASKFGPG